MSYVRERVVSAAFVVSAVVSATVVAVDVPSETVPPHAARTEHDAIRAEAPSKILILIFIVLSSPLKINEPDQLPYYIIANH